MSWIQTYTGKKFDFKNITADSIDILDIAHSLSQICRFGGHSKRFYSVAEHSVEVANHMPQGLWGILGLLHDAHEAYIGDITRPLKNRIRVKTEIVYTYQFQIDRAIEAKFMLPACSLAYDSIVESDNRMLATEQLQLLGPVPEEWDWVGEGVKPYPDILQCLKPEDADVRFLAMFERLMKEVNHGK